MYKGRNWPSNIDGPNVALTVIGDREYFQFYIAVFPPMRALDLAAGPGPAPRRLGERWYQALTRAAIEEIETQIRDGYRPDPEVSKRINALFIYVDPARVRTLERGHDRLPEIQDGLFAGIEVAKFHT